jgi:hypothetical protein
MTAILIKTAEYSPIIHKGESLFDAYQQSGLQMSQPDVKQPVTLHLDTTLPE